jgi:hypothetical protein
MADAETCQRIICGATSQDEAGLETLFACSQAGYVGALPCSHPSCQPFMSELRSKGVCAMPVQEQWAAEVLPLHPPVPPDPGEAPLPPVPTALLPADLVAPMPSIVNRPAPSNPEEPEGTVAPWQGTYCRAMNWVADNQWMAAAAVVAGWYFLAREKR